MKRTATLLACAALLAGAGDASAAKKEKEASTKPDFVGAYGDWKVYHTGSGKGRICYLLAEPKSRDPADAKLEKAYAFISERPAERVRNEVSFVMGFEVSAAAEAKDKKAAAEAKDKKKDKKPKKDETSETAAPTVTIGESDFDLVPKGNDLWVKNAAEESRVIDEMRKGAALVIKAASHKGRKTTDTYSLTGFSQAVDKALKDCPGG